MEDAAALVGVELQGGQELATDELAWEAVADGAWAAGLWGEHKGGLLVVGVGEGEGCWVLGDG